MRNTPKIVVHFILPKTVFLLDFIKCETITGIRLVLILVLIFVIYRVVKRLKSSYLIDALLALFKHYFGFFSVIDTYSYSNFEEFHATALNKQAKNATRGAEMIAEY